MASNLKKWFLSIALLAACGFANAAIVYEVDLDVGTGSATGTITTNGDIGTLTTGDILDWTIVLDGNPGNVFTLFGPLSGNNSGLAVVGVGFVASASELTFDFGGSGYALFQNPNTGSGINYLCFAGALCGNFANAINLGTNAFGVNTSPQRGVQVVATAANAVPEPASIALLGLALAGLGFASRRRAR